MKQKLIRSIFLFLGMLLICTILSKSIYSYLLPVVSTTKVHSGMVEVKYIATGKVGIDKEALENQKVTLMPNMGGKVIEVLKQEGEVVQQGDVICRIQRTDYETTSQNKELEKTQLLLEAEHLVRDETNKKAQYEMIEKDYKDKEKELEAIDTNSKIVSLNEEIAKQRDTVAITAELYKEGLAAQQTYKEEETKLTQLERDLKDQEEQARFAIHKELEALQKEQKELETSLADLSDQRILNEKKQSILGKTSLEETLTSPITGYMYTLNVSKGAYVSQNEKLAIIVPNDLAYCLSFEVEEAIAAKLQVGGQVSFNSMQKEYQANIVKKKFNETTGKTVMSCEVAQEILDKLDLETSSYKMVDVKITNSSSSYAMLVENSAIKTVYGSYSVFVVEESSGIGGTIYKLREVPVTILEEGDYKTAISGTMDKDMKIVSSQISELEDRQEVRLQ